MNEELNKKKKAIINLKGKLEKINLMILYGGAWFKYKTPITSAKSFEYDKRNCYRYLKNKIEERIEYLETIINYWEDKISWNRLIKDELNSL